DEERAKHGHFELHEKGFVKLGIDKAALIRSKTLLQRLDEKTQYDVRKIKADRARYQQRGDGDEQSSAQFDQMVEQRRFGIINFLHEADDPPRAPSGATSRGRRGWSGMAAARLISSG